MTEVHYRPESTPSSSDRRRVRALHSLAGVLTRYLLALICAAAFAIPLYWLAISSLKPTSDIFTFPPDWIPLHPDLGNFVRAWRSAPFARYTLNSVITAVVGTAGEVSTACLCAYAFAYLHIPGKRILFGILLGAMMIPGSVTLLPNFLTVSDLGWNNTYAGLIVPGFGSVFVTFLMRQHMLGLPREILEAAELEGAGHLRKLWSVVLPLSRPMLITGGLITFIYKWNEYIWPLVVTNTDDMRTLQIGLVFTQATENGADWGIVMAATAFVAGPMLIAYFVAQRHIVAGVLQGAVK